MTFLLLKIPFDEKFGEHLDLDLDKFILYYFHITKSNLKEKRDRLTNETQIKLIVRKVDTVRS